MRLPLASVPHLERTTCACLTPCLDAGAWLDSPTAHGPHMIGCSSQPCSSCLHRSRLHGVNAASGWCLLFNHPRTPAIYCIPTS
ncbi:hypothetical protein M404DRAFT_357111 [Pisolithus tinctorius Marx 270]|uniref:Uncharacterized protein n=1 Tax=Pisolithus tinctorius Marx 270 TaxID=870435 RepID=A0A0C3KFU2_PISTI|nr:hypothetical protein M404DRAFT_357111 [Pisolithus tinctorius Marx 270]